MATPEPAHDVPMSDPPMTEGRVDSMRSGRDSRALARRHLPLGAIAWLLCTQFFVVQVVVASAWEQPPYSWRLDAISDLGARGCGEFDDRYVCSPLHGLMNTSLVLLGLCMIVGSVLLHRGSRGGRAGFGLMAAAGVGAVLVGVFPEDTVFWSHILGQDLAFLFGNVAMIVIGLSLSAPRWLHWYSVASGVVALVGLFLFLSHHRLFLDLGGMERVVAYPLTIWLVVFGAYALLHHGQLAAEVPPADERRGRRSDPAHEPSGP